MSHSRAKLSPFGRRLLCERIASRFPVRVAARTVGISDARAYVIWHRYLDEGPRARAIAFSHIAHSYNHRRIHGALGGLTPMQRLLADVNNVRGQYT